MSTPILKSQLDKFLHWIKERHSIYVKREVQKKPKPWSDDPVMQRVFFTNPYRENDKVTVWFRENIREELRDDPAVFFATVAFRRFNSIQTGQVLLENNLHLKWDKKLAEQAIMKMVNSTRPPGAYLSGAYMIKGGEPGRNKLNFLCEINEHIYKHRLDHVKALESCSTLQAGHKHLARMVNVGPFIAYEWLTDLRHTYLFEDASDLRTWCSFGPGARRGLNRLIHGKPAKPLPPNFLGVMRSLLDIVEKANPTMPPFELREIEHSLCEFDKYMRVAEGGKPKRWYNGVASSFKRPRA